jgi:hypothetical protein
MQACKHMYTPDTQVQRKEQVEWVFDSFSHKGPHSAGLHCTDFTAHHNHSLTHTHTCKHAHTLSLTHTRGIACFQPPSTPHTCSQHNNPTRPLEKFFFQAFVQYQ